MIGHPKPIKYENSRLLKLARQLPCAACGREDGTVVAAHSNQLRDGKGRSVKAHDYRIAAMCHQCHGEIDQGQTMDKQQKHEAWDEYHRRTIGELFERNLIIVNPDIKV